MIRTSHATALRSATSKSVRVLEIITLHVRMDDCRVRVDFGIIRNTSVPILLGTSVINRFVKRVFPAERKVAPYNFRQIPILKITMLTSEDDPKNSIFKASFLLVESEHVKPQKVQVVRRVKWLPMTQCAALVSTNVGGMLQVSSLPSFSKRYHYKTTNRIMGVFPGHSLYCWFRTHRMQFFTFCSEKVSVLLVYHVPPSFKVVWMNVVIIHRVNQPSASKLLVWSITNGSINRRWNALNRCDGTKRWRKMTKRNWSVTGNKRCQFPTRFLCIERNSLICSVQSRIYGTVILDEVPPPNTKLSSLMTILDQYTVIHIGMILKLTNLQLRRSKRC